MIPISVILPVGQLERHSTNLAECILSVLPQLTHPDDQLLILDNGLGLRDPLSLDVTPDKVDLYQIPWAVGIASGYNIGIAIAKNENCFMLGSDDLLLPNCLDWCRRAHVREGGRVGYYWVGVEYSDGNTQMGACMVAMVSKTLWNRLGGFELGSDYGFNSLNMPVRNCEGVAVSKIMLNDKIGELIQVCDQVLYWVRLRDNYHSSSVFQ